MFKVEVRQSRVTDDRWLWEWRVLSRWGIVVAEGGGCETEVEARLDGHLEASKLQEVRERTTWRS